MLGVLIGVGKLQTEPIKKNKWSAIGAILRNCTWQNHFEKKLATGLSFFFLWSLSRTSLPIILYCYFPLRCFYISNLLLFWSEISSQTFFTGNGEILLIPKKLRSKIWLEPYFCWFGPVGSWLLRCSIECQKILYQWSFWKVQQW